jgi:hypothetical protein
VRTRTKVALVVGLAAGVVAVVSLAMRSSAKEGLEGLLERLRRDGRLPSLETLRAGMAVDPEVQRKVRAWADADDPRLPWEAMNEWSNDPDGEPVPEALVAWAEQFRPRAEALAGLLEAGSVRFTPPAWATEVAPSPSGRTSASPLVRPRAGPSIMRAFDAAQWFALTSRTDPATLRSLDRLVESASPPGSAIDVHAAAFLSKMRDDAYARAVLRGAVAPQDVERWLADPPALHLAFADAMRADRTLLWEPVARALLDGENVGLRPWTKEVDDPADLWEQHLSPWLHGREDCRRFLEYHVAFEDAIRSGDGRPAAAALAAVADVGWPFAAWGGDGPVGHARSTAFLFARIGALRRAARIVAILAADPSGAGLPATEAELRGRLGARAAWMDGGPMVFGLRYERVADDVARLTVVPRDPLPGLPASEVRVEPAGEPLAAPAVFSWDDDRIEARVPPR